MSSVLQHIPPIDLHDFFTNIDLTTLAVAAPSLFILAHLVPYLWDSHAARSIPGPFLAKFTDAWLGLVAKNGHRSEVVHEMHQKYGPLVRLAPNHISIADPDALNIVYAHGNGALKSNFYDAFVSIRRGVFNTRDRQEHARKRKIVSHIFSQKSVVEFEPHIRQHVADLIAQWDHPPPPPDVRPGVNYLAFDIVGDLAFGAPFGMIAAAKDVAKVPRNQEGAMDSYGKDDSDEDAVEVPAVKILNGRGEYSMALGVLPPWWRPFVRMIPWYRRGSKDVKTLAGIAIMAVKKRLASPTDRVDLLSKLKAGRDSNGNPMGREELTAEALTLLIAGSDTTSNSTCAIIYHLAHNPHIQQRLHHELDEQLGTEDEIAATADQVKRLPYLEACINEGLRIHSTSAIGLPRVIPDGGLTILGHFFPAGTVVSVPSYSIHRDTAIWGEDVEDYRPERWFERDQAAMQKTFNPFSVGPRACVGRNLAFLELQIICASLLRRYEFVLESPDEPLGLQLQTSEGFLRKPLGCMVGIKRRDV
ncbi:hypothetical protein H0H81_003645 [Sphagnurus paluster]|uniref:Uncharacterized protein n=1 Tax=Sphagnurus paluster TaxID=117069 RepID=A0A9P7FZG9_9AGAR|nr:hypothetical protein H0H81_003645 [Sphagnurus paluster]